MWQQIPVAARSTVLQQALRCRCTRLTRQMAVHLGNDEQRAEVPLQMWAGMSVVAVQMLVGEPGPGADVGRWAGALHEREVLHGRVNHRRLLRVVVPKYDLVAARESRVAGCVLQRRGRLAYALATRRRHTMA